jgi:pre-mRNA-splicing factor ATP-dependent RNA helicase DHX15/PRP43
VPNVWLRPTNKRKEADQAKALLTIPDSDHLTLLNVYNSWMQSMHGDFLPGFLFDHSFSDSGRSNWSRTNYVSHRALSQADNVRRQLESTMIRFDVDVVSVGEGPKLYHRTREALVCGFFMQVAHKEEKTYVTIKDNQQVTLHPSCGLDSQPEWVLFNEFVLTTRPYIRTVTTVDPEWFVRHSKLMQLIVDVSFRLLRDAASYYDIDSWKDGEAKSGLLRVRKKLLGKRGAKKAKTER